MLTLAQAEIFDGPIVIGDGVTNEKEIEDVRIPRFL